MGVARRQSALGPRVGHDCQRPAATGHGYHVVDLGGHVYAFGDAPYLGAVTPPVAVRGHQMRVLERAPPTGFGASPMCRSGTGNSRKHGHPPRSHPCAPDSALVRGHLRREAVGNRDAFSRSRSAYCPR